MRKRINYKLRIAINIAVILLAAGIWFSRGIDPYLSEQHRLDSIIQKNFATQADIIYEYRDPDSDHMETHYILHKDGDYTYLNVFNPLSTDGHTYMGKPTRNAVDLCFAEDLAVVELFEYNTEYDEKYNTNSAFVAVVCRNDAVETVELEFWNGKLKDREKLENMGNGVFHGGVQTDFHIISGHTSAELRSATYTAKGYDKDGNLICINKCQEQIMSERTEDK